MFVRVWEYDVLPARVNRFRDETSWVEFRRDHAADYERLDEQYSGLTVAQRELAP
jgi:hypothetical protein